jgi:tetratricopeptide (TPR) repeat protein
MKRILVFTFSFLFFSALISPAFSQTFKELVTKYRELQKEKDYEEAVEILDLMLKKYPNTEPEVTYFNRGNTYRHLQEFKKAIKDYNKAIEIKPDYTEAYNNRANSYFDLEEFDKAISDYTSLIKFIPGNYYAYFNRANAYSQLFKYDSAVVDYTKAIELKPDFANAYYNRGNKYYGMSMYKEAIEDWKKVIKLDPAYESALQSKIDDAKSLIDKKK